MHELIFLTGSHSMQGQHYQPNPTLLHQGCKPVKVYPATCTFGRMIRVFYVPLQWHRGGKDTQQESAQKVNSRKFSCCSCWLSNPRPSNHKSSTLPTELLSALLDIVPCRTTLSRSTAPWKQISSCCSLYSTLAIPPKTIKHCHTTVEWNVQLSWGQTHFASPIGHCPVQRQWHIKDPGHSAKSAGGKILLHTRTPLTQRSRSLLTALFRHRVGTYQRNEPTRNSYRNARPQSSQLANLLWTCLLYTSDAADD